MVAPVDILEVLRAVLHSSRPDWLELGAVLASMDDVPDAVVVWDYLGDVAAQRRDEGGRHAWALTWLLMEHAPEHPSCPGFDSVDVGFVPQERRFLCLAAAARRERGAAPADFALRWAECVDADALSLSAALDGLLTAMTLAACRPEPRDPMLAQRLCSIARGARGWDAETHGRALLGRPVSSNVDLFERLWGTLTEQVGVYFLNRASRAPIAAREVRYASLGAFAQVACPASAILSLTRPHWVWTAEDRDAICARLWAEAANVMVRAEFLLPNWSQRDGLVRQQPGPSLAGVDGTHALEIGLSAAESMAALGQREASAAVADVLHHRLMAHEPVSALMFGYIRWAARLISI